MRTAKCARNFNKQSKQIVHFNGFTLIFFGTEKVFKDSSKVASVHSPALEVNEKLREKIKMK